MAATNRRTTPSQGRRDISHAGLAALPSLGRKPASTFIAMAGVRLRFPGDARRKAVTGRFPEACQFRESRQGSSAWVAPAFGDAVPGCEIASMSMAVIG